MNDIPSSMRIDPETLRRARLTVAGHAANRADATELLAMLGLTEQQPTRSAPRSNPVRNPGSCVKCGVATGDRRAADHGGARYGGRGRCDACYKKLIRAERKTSSGERTPRRRVIERSR
ncbi:hypothetical protein ACFWF7_38690 [Nocardia sp. NPDC060256]|uniref:hypothetical protein n=1 Tax=unclassified Nocardia TaxID=2637762 RepID=UPI00364B16A5